MACRTQKRTRAIRRAPNGSAFQQCEKCGVSVAVALLDMHECEPNPKVKRFKGPPCIRPPRKLNPQDQPRSPFRFFMEDFAKECEGEDEIAIDRKGFEKWKKMSQEDRKLYVIRADKVDKSYRKVLLEEEKSISRVDDEADSAEVGKCDKNYGQEQHFDDDDYDNDDSDDNDDDDDCGGSLFGSENNDSTHWGKRILDELKK